MLTCRELIGFLDRYLDGELPAAEVARFDHHLSLCPECVEYLHSYRQTVRLAADAWCDEDAALSVAPPALVDAILRARAGLAEAD